MILAATWLNVVSLGNVASVVVVLAVGYAYLRRESGSVWKSVAEGLEKKVQLLEEQNRLLTNENAELRAKPDMEMVSGLLIRHGLLLDGLEDRVEKHAKASDERHVAIMGALEAIARSPQRSPATRSRSTD